MKIQAYDLDEICVVLEKGEENRITIYCNSYDDAVELKEKIKIALLQHTEEPTTDPEP